MLGSPVWALMSRIHQRTSTDSTSTYSAASSSADTFSLRNSVEVTPAAVLRAQVLVPAPLCNDMKFIDVTSSQEAAEKIPSSTDYISDKISTPFISRPVTTPDLRTSTLSTQVAATELVTAVEHNDSHH
jgi:hypothetical protein